MRRLHSAAALAILGMLLVPGTSRAGFEDLGAGARPFGMADAFTALADDASALYFNPAGMAGIYRPEFTASHAKLHMGLSDGSGISSSYLAYAHPLGEHGTAGIGYDALTLSGFFSERAFLLGYSRRLRERLDAGITLKLLERSFTLGSDPYLTNDPLFQSHGAKSSGFSVDAGLLYRLQGPYTLGFAVKDLNEPDMALDSGDKVPKSLKFAFAYRPGKLAADAELVLRDGDWDFLAGAERDFMRRRLAARMGFGIGSRSDRDVNVGATFRADHYQIDYAFQFPLSGIAGTTGTHRFAFTVRFGAPGPNEFPEEEPPEPEGPTMKDRLRDLGFELEKSREENRKAQAEILKRLDKHFNGRRRAPAAPKKPKQRPKSYKVGTGDTLQSIAEKLYGDEARWVDIYRVNQGQIGVGGRLRKGQRLMIP